MELHAWGNWLVKAVYGAGGLAALAVTLLYFFQEKLLYVPVIPGFAKEYQYTPDQFHLGFEDVWLNASDGVKIHGWFLWLKPWTKEFMKTRPVVMFFQENAGNMSFRLAFLKELARRLQCPVFAVSYRGYGWSEGRPSEAGLQRDAQAALDHVLRRQDADTSRIVLFGRSLGGAVAIHLAARNQDRVKALIVENTFTRIEDMVPAVLPFLGLLIGTGRPANFLVRNKWANIYELPKIKEMPILMMTSMQDEMVPPRQMKMLCDAATTPNLETVEFPDAHHMDAYDTASAAYWPSLSNFVNKFVV